MTNRPTDASSSERFNDNLSERTDSRFQLGRADPTRRSVKRPIAAGRVEYDNPDRTPEEYAAVSPTPCSGPPGSTEHRGAGGDPL